MGLKLTSNIKIKKNILNFNIKSLKQLVENVQQFFKESTHQIVRSNIFGPRFWRFDVKNLDGIRMEQSYVIDFISEKDKTTLIKRLRFGVDHDKKIYVQLLLKNYKGQLEMCKLLGNDTTSQLNIGDNFYDWLLNIKSNNFDINLMKLFNLMK